MERPGQPTRPRHDEQHTPEYRTVAVYWTIPEAELARGLLAAEGIPVAALDVVDATLLPGTAPVRLLVPARDLDRSRLILEARGAPAPAGEAAPSSEPGAVRGASWSRVALAVVLLAALLVAAALAL